MIVENYFLLIVILMAIGTLLIRGSFIALSSRLIIATKIRELFTFIPAAIFPALIVPATFFHQGRVESLGGKERFLVLLVTCVVCYFRKSTLFVICFGLVTLYLVRTFFS